MEDEIASISAIIGASWAGAKAMTATSGPGLSLMMEGIGYAAFTETPCVIIDIQRAGPATGQATRVGSGDIMQVKWGSHGDYQIIALSPWSVQEMYELTIQAFNLAERFRVPVFVLGDQAVGHLEECMEVKEEVEIFNRIQLPRVPFFDTKNDDGVPPMVHFGEGERVLVTGSTHDGYGYRKTEDSETQSRLVNRINKKILNNQKEIVETSAYFLDDAQVVIIAYGFTARSALQAVKDLREEGKKVGLLRLKTIWPFPSEAIMALSSAIFIPEMNLGQLAGEVRKWSKNEVIGFSQSNGEVIYPATILNQLKSLL